MSGKDNKTTEPDKSTEPNKSNETPEETGEKEIISIEELKKQFPETCDELAQTIAENVVKKVKNLTVIQFRQQFPDLYQAIAKALMPKTSVNLNAPGFLLAVDDPFAAGALRVYGREKDIADFRLPFVLPEKDKATIPALESYITRASGGGDTKRAEEAKKALKKVKK